MILALGSWVVDEAAHQRRCWGELLAADQFLCINVSSRQLTSRDFAPNLLSALRANNVPFAGFGVEVTETALAHDPPVAAASLHALREVGVRVLLDDFGTGYSSMSQLTALPVDLIKLDRSFISDIDQRPEGREIVDALIRMAHAAKLQVIAEGVEGPREAAVLRELHCDFAQGFLFARPSPAEEVSRRLGDLVCDSSLAACAGEPRGHD